MEDFNGFDFSSFLGVVVLEVWLDLIKEWIWEREREKKFFFKKIVGKWDGSWGWW